MGNLISDELVRRTTGTNPDVVADEFGKSMRNNDLENWENGDTFTFPEDFKGKVLKHFPDPEKEDYFEYILVEVTRKDGGRKVVLPFYPSSTTKSAFAIECDAEGKPTEEGKKGKIAKVVKASGNVVIRMKKHASVNDAMKSVAGLTVTVNVQRPIIISKYGNHANEPWPTSVLEISSEALDENGEKK